LTSTGSAKIRKAAISLPSGDPPPETPSWPFYFVCVPRTQSLSEFPMWLQDLCNAETQKSHLNLKTLAVFPSQQTASFLTEPSQKPLSQRPHMTPSPLFDGRCSFPTSHLHSSGDGGGGGGGGGDGGCCRRIQQARPRSQPQLRSLGGDQPHASSAKPVECAWRPRSPTCEH